MSGFQKVVLRLGGCCLALVLMVAPHYSQGEQKQPQAKTKAEYDSYMVLFSEQNQSNKVELAGKFLQDYPHLIISCLYLDFDIYQPTKTALECFAPRVCKGGIIVFDELNEEAFPGETLAVMEYFEINKLKVQRFPFEPRISYVVIGE